MVLVAGGFYAILALFIQWNFQTAAADGYGTEQPTILDLAIPVARDVGIYLVVASGIYLLKRLFVRRQPRKPSNID